MLRSTHGKALLALIQETHFSNTDISSRTVIEFTQNVRNIISIDPISPRLSDAETGNNSFHFLLSRSFSTDVIINIFSLLLSNGTEGLRKANLQGELPLHVYLSTQRSLDANVVQLLLHAHPEAAIRANNIGLIPLFLCVMREDSSAEICRLLCKANPLGPATLNSTSSYPLHFACRRFRPNLDLIQILMRRHPAAASHVNSHSLLPLHCLCTASDNVQVAQLLLSAFPAAISVVDRQGRTPLHLAVLAVGKEHAKAIQQEEDAEVEELTRKMADMQTENKNTEDNDYNFENDFDESSKSRRKQNSMLTRAGTKSRHLVDYLCRVGPKSLVTENNFQATPVETVLIKAKEQRTKKKTVKVFGLCDDPLTARLLLLHHHHQQLLALLPRMKPVHREELRELNWQARKASLLASYDDLESRQSLSRKEGGGDKVKTAGKGSKTLLKSSSSATPSTTVFTNLNPSYNGSTVSKKDGVSGGHDAAVRSQANVNILARLRTRGLSVLLPLILQYI